ncbi:MULTISPECIES: ABC transporter ATP-binding protein [unclassified Streptomyces]|uniref:ABC transporter ATP-binding protein n=1 Tax=unclassified Streptomyces TaxID=2593676 RepID=UPI002DDB6AA5|nr:MULTISPECIES: ABC transporter ATP-binding protein [unclassified Streptomyces]WSA93393.1 ABC transporter ATP-binding protein [Streptomyces sp. NBC_01795]WSS13990.1 ABC transporter ATP-binding protein [Streptomyces sp. NBC_01186]WSS42810.1 ABC transporter ATP-binding protein [Streptomyces sp. NBC_01187]
MFGERRGAGTATAEREGQGRVSEALVLEGISREYRRGSVALHPLDLTVPRGRFLAVMGPSGCGKSTLLQCAAGLDRPTSGTVRIGGTELASLKEAALTRLRRERVGFVFQAHNLVPSLSVVENVALPLLLGGAAPDGRALHGLAAVGLADRADDAPAELSGGQRQRVAIARALVTRPEIVFADEPTGALDFVTAGDVLALLRQAVDVEGHTVVMVTHDPEAAAWADEALFLMHGRTVGKLERPGPDDVRRALVDMNARDGERQR